MKILFAVLVTLVQLVPAAAQDHAGHGAMSAASPATQAYMDANRTMHEDMAIDYSGDPDVDFIRSMLPHHQGAVAMARIVLEHGKDPEVKALAQDIIAAQDKEIAWMQAWLAEHAD